MRFRNVMTPLMTLKPTPSTREKGLTEKRLREKLPPEDAPYEVSDHSVRGEGCLLVRVMPTGMIVFFFRYTLSGKKTYLQIGRWSQRKGDGGVTLQEAREEKGKLVGLLKKHGDVKEHMRLEALNVLRMQTAEEASRSLPTLRQLLEEYVEKLKGRNAPSAHDTEITLQKHVLDAFPSLANTVANQVTADDIAEILSLMIENGIRRRVNVVRTMLHAAFVLAGKSDHDPARRAENRRKFQLNGNPVALVPTQQGSEYKRTRKRVLSDEELRLVWKGVASRLPATRVAVRVVILLGGQRVTQLMRSRWSDYNQDEGTLNLVDLKGRGGPHDHLLPVSTWVATLLAELPRSDSYIFPTSQGKRNGLPLTVENLSGVIRNIAREHVLDFTLSDIRRTAETKLASLRVPKSERARLLSHGLNNVQDLHYDMWEYIPEKREGLDKWESYLRGIAICLEDGTPDLPLRAVAS